MAAVLCCVCAGYLLPASSNLLIAAAVTAGAVITAVSAVHLGTPVSGLTLLLVAAVVAPVEVPVGTSTASASVLLAALTCGGFLVRTITARGRSGLDNSPVVAAALAFLIVSVIAFIVGQYPWFPTAHAPMRAQLGGLAMFLLSGGLFLAVGHQVRTVQQLQHLTWVFVGCGTLAVATLVAPFGNLQVGPVAITSADSIGSGFWTWIVAVSLSQALFNRALAVPARAALAAVTAVALGRGLVMAGSWASGWLPPLVAVVVLMLLRFPRATVSASLLCVTPALLFGAPLFRSWMAVEAYSATTRFEALRIMWQIVQHNPWLGFGPANYYHYTQLFPILGWWVRFNSHNNYLDLLGQVGVIGLLAFLWFALEALRLAVRLRGGFWGGFERAYLSGALAGLCGCLVSGLLGDWIVPFTYNVGIRGLRSSLLFWFFLGGVLSLKRIASAAPTAASCAVAR